MHLDSFDPEAPGRGLGEPASKVWGDFSFIGRMRFGPSVRISSIDMHLQLAPGLSIQNPHPQIQGATASHEANAATAANASKVLAFGPTLDSVDPFASAPWP